MRILYVTDLHGHAPKYEMTIEAAEEEAVDIILNGGDIFPHGDANSQMEFLEEGLRIHFQEAEKKGLRYLCSFGNEDLLSMESHLKALCSEFSNVSYISLTPEKIGEWYFVGFPFVNDYPFPLRDWSRRDLANSQSAVKGYGLLSSPRGFRRIEDWASYSLTLPSLEEELENLPEPPAGSEMIYVIHPPPAGMGLDVCSSGKKAGSQAVLEFIKKRRPLLSFHGHIHESYELSRRWYAELNGTFCIQPGQSEKNKGELVYVIVELGEAAGETPHSSKTIVELRRAEKR